MSVSTLVTHERLRALLQAEADLAAARAEIERLSTARAEWERAVFRQDAELAALRARSEAAVKLADWLRQAIEPTSAEYSAECDRLGVVQLFNREYVEWIGGRVLAAVKGLEPDLLAAYRAARVRSGR